MMTIIGCVSEQF